MAAKISHLVRGWRLVPPSSKPSSPKVVATAMAIRPAGAWAERRAYGVSARRSRPASMAAIAAGVSIGPSGFLNPTL